MNYNSDISASVGAYVHDAEPSVQLRSDLATPVVASGSNAALAMSLKAAGQFAVNITVTDADDADADETYSLVIEADADGGFGGNEIVVGTEEIPRGYSGSFISGLYGPGIVRRLVAAGAIADDNADTALRVRHVLGGTTPSLNYAAQVGPIIGGL